MATGEVLRRGRVREQRKYGSELKRTRQKGGLGQGAGFLVRAKAMRLGTNLSAAMTLLKAPID
jgi:hypothetical protein